MIRNPQYQKCTDAMEQAADDALMALPAKRANEAAKAAYGIIYVDSRGESGRLKISQRITHLNS